MEKVSKLSTAYSFYFFNREKKKKCMQDKFYHQLK